MKTKPRSGTLEPLVNPFTPSEIAALPDQFFGRDKQLDMIKTSLPIGSVLVQGPIGIGKSSLLARALDWIGSDDCDTKIVVADAEITTVDAAARLVLDGLVEVKENRKIRLKLGLKMFSAMEPNIEWESGQAVRDFQEGRHLAVLKRILEEDHQRRQKQHRKLIVIGIDEADKAAPALTRLVRAVWTHCQQVGVNDMRFMVAGGSPVHQQMVAEDQGVTRAFNRVINLAPMSFDETQNLLGIKIAAIKDAATKAGKPLGVDPEVIDRIANLSGGHPHIVQLLGSHLVQHENEHPDNLLSTDDLVGALRRVCYEDRGATYAATLHVIENAGKLSALSTLLNQSGLTAKGFPTRIYRRIAMEVVADPDIQWLVEHNILVPISSEEYGLTDEFLRVRMTFDTSEPGLREQMEDYLIRQGRVSSWDDIQQVYQDDYENQALEEEDEE